MNRIIQWLRRQPEPAPNPTFDPYFIPPNSYVRICDRCGCLVGATLTHKRRGC